MNLGPVAHDDRGGTWPQVHVVATADAVAEHAARLIARWIADSRRDHGVVHVALAGGRTPGATYRRLAALVDDWSDVHLWLGDERLVPAGDPLANIHAIRRDLVLPAAIPADQVHPVVTGLSADAAAADYERQIRAALPAPPGRATPRFSLVLLGLGEDGHVASLFPGGAGLATDRVCVGVTDAPKPPARRISLSLGAINAAARRLVIATGAAKTEPLARALSGAEPASPAALLAPVDTVVIVDADAARLLRRVPRPHAPH